MANPVTQPLAGGTALSAIVLAGGQSSRLGVNKALLRLAGQAMIARIVDRLRVVTDDVIIVTNEPDDYAPLDLAASLVRDERPGEGSLMGIYSGLRAAAGHHALVVACDMPFLHLPLLRYMAALTPGSDVVVPRVGEWLEPLHAIYGKRCLGPIAALLAQHRRQIVAFYGDVDVRYVEETEIARYDPGRLSFVNVNTPEDWQRVQELSQDLS